MDKQDPQDDMGSPAKRFDTGYILMKSRRGIPTRILLLGVAVTAFAGGGLWLFLR